MRAWTHGQRREDGPRLAATGRSRRERAKRAAGAMGAGAVWTLIGAVCAPPAAAQASFSVEDVLSYSFASGLVASPAGERVAWVENREGERNVWVAEGPSWRGRAVTQYEGDDGQELASLAFTPDGERILFVRGGAPNSQGEVPDPRFTPEAEGRAVWIVDVDGGTPRQVVEAGGFALAPGGDRLAFTRAREIWTVTLEEDAEATRLARVRGGPGGLTWSPDGARLAFTSGRGDHGFVGVLDADGARVTYLDPSVHHDGHPAWSPDSRSIAFLRQPNERDIFPFLPVREAIPFSIRVADATTGVGREVWRAHDGVGSAFSGVDAESQIFWGTGDRLVFPWEGDGWKHLYAVPASGGDATLLTPGDFEVQFAALAPDRGSVLYDSNQGQTDGKHVWRVAVDGGAPVAVTSGEGIEWGAVATPAGAVAYHASGARSPAHTEVKEARRTVRPGPPVSEAFPPEAFVEPRSVTFPASDGQTVHGQLFLPHGERPEGGWPAVLFFHGGSRRQMLLGFHPRGYYHGAYAFNQLLASRGYVVLAVNYRSGIGYGMEFREALDYGAAGASEFADVLGAADFLASTGNVDPSRVGLWGGSYGGYLTALGLARASDRFAAGVDLHGVHDWNVVVQNFVPSYQPAEHPDFAARARASSPMAFLDGWTSPVLLIHGDDDRNVPFSESVDLAEALAKRGVPFEQLVFPDEVHGFLLHENWVRAFEAASDFLDRKLKGAPARAAPAIGGGGVAGTGRGVTEAAAGVAGTGRGVTEAAAGVADAGDTRLERLYGQGTSFRPFLAGAEARVDLWHAHWNDGRLPAHLEALAERARRVPGRFRMLAVAVAGCSDSVNTIPYLALLAEAVPNLDLRIVDSDAGRWVMDARPTPDGRGATPTVVLLDAEGSEVGCLVERPDALVRWFDENRSRLEGTALFEGKMAWYATDSGRSTVGDVVAMLERAGAGRPTGCGAGG